jgi:hypothetical protein
VRCTTTTIPCMVLLIPDTSFLVSGHSVSLAGRISAPLSSFIGQQRYTASHDADTQEILTTAERVQQLIKVRYQRFHSIPLSRRQTAHAALETCQGCGCLCSGCTYWCQSTSIRHCMRCRTLWLSFQGMPTRMKGMAFIPPIRHVPRSGSLDSCLDAQLAALLCRCMAHSLNRE